MTSAKPWADRPGCWAVSVLTHFTTFTHHIWACKATHSLTAADLSACKASLLQAAWTRAAQWDLGCLPGCYVVGVWPEGQGCCLLCCRLPGPWAGLELAPSLLHKGPCWSCVQVSTHGLRPKSSSQATPTTTSHAN